MAHHSFYNIIPALGRQRQVILCEFKDSLVYRVTSRTKIHSNAVSKSQKLKIKEIEFKRKSQKDGKYTENLDTVCYYAQRLLKDTCL